MKTGFLKSKSGVVVPGQPGSQILLARQTYCLSISNKIFEEQQQQIIWKVFCGFVFYRYLCSKKILSCPVDN
jgi:hypothetical protein